MRIPMLVMIVLAIFTFGLFSQVGFTQGNLASPRLARVAGAQEVNYEYLNKERNIVNKLPVPMDVDTKDDTRGSVSKTLEVIVPKQNNINIESAAAFIWDPSREKEIYSKNSQAKRSIASITKLMTALVFLDHNPGWQTVKEITPSDRREGGRIYLYNGEKVLVKDLFNLSLVASANTATMALVHSTGLEESEFVYLMNQKAKELGLKNTHFNDPVGLNEGNVSNAREIALLAQTAFSRKEIKEATQRKQYRFATQGGRIKVVYNTNLLLKNPPQGFKVIGGKTGHINVAGYCLVSEFEDMDGHKIISVVLGAPDYYARFKETRKLIEWASGYIY